MNENQIVVKHYTRFWGKPSATFRFDHEVKLAPSPIYILKFPPSTEDQDWVYASAGASSYAMPYPEGWTHEKPERHIEIFIYVRYECDELVQTLASLALYPFNNQTFLDINHVIPGNQGIVKNSPITDVLFTRPYGEPPEFEIIHGQLHIQMLWAIPIYKAEYKFFKKRGWEALKELFYQYKSDTSDFMRSPVISNSDSDQNPVQE